MPRRKITIQRALAIALLLSLPSTCLADGLRLELAVGPTYNFYGASLELQTPYTLGTSIHLLYPTSQTNLLGLAIALSTPISLRAFGGNYGMLGLIGAHDRYYLGKDMQEGGFVGASLGAATLDIWAGGTQQPRRWGFGSEIEIGYASQISTSITGIIKIAPLLSYCGSELNLVVPMYFGFQF